MKADRQTAAPYPHHCRAITLLNINIAITKLINKHIEANNFVREEQKRYKKNQEDINRN